MEDFIKRKIDEWKKLTGFGDLLNVGKMKSQVKFLEKSLTEAVERTREEENTDVRKAVVALADLVVRNQETPELVKISSILIKAFEEEQQSRYVASLLEKIDRLKIEKSQAVKDFREELKAWVEEKKDSRDVTYEEQTELNMGYCDCLDNLIQYLNK